MCVAARVMNSEKWGRIVNNTLPTQEWGVRERTTPNSLCRISPSTHTHQKQSHSS